MEFTDLLAYKKGFALAMKIFEISKSFPKEEKYSLTDQIRRSSRSVCSNLAEAIENEITPNTLSVNLVIVMVKTVKL